MRHTLRLLAGMTQETLGQHARLSKPMISAIERGTRIPKPDIADAFDSSLSTGGSLKRLWRELSDTREVPDWFQDALLIERRAHEIREYDPLVIPGLLQTYDYARTLIRAWNVGCSEEHVDHITRARADRLPALLGNRPLMRFVVREAAVTDTVGSDMIMKEQLEYVSRLIEERTIRFQILPRSPHGPGTCLPLRISTLSPTQAVGYVEHALGGEVVETPEKVSELMTVFGELQAAALPPNDSATLLRRIQGEL
ncbi:MAG: helix-turn-helix transcriptional regulator [Nocardiopsaceae bacterium]|nr:helix-turn-helix transcriptional regulator [Nocardiopsaceae bacterium]